LNEKDKEYKMKMKDYQNSKTRKLKSLEKEHILFKRKPRKEEIKSLMILKSHKLISKDFRKSKINLIFLKKGVCNVKKRIVHQRSAQSKKEKLKNLKLKLLF